MKKFQDWVQQRQYTRHLDILSKIRSRSCEQHKHPRKKSISPHVNPQNKKNNYLPINSLPIAVKEAFRSINTQRTMTLSQKETLLQNYLLCKRLTDTPPVIVKKQHDKDYQNHKVVMKRLSIYHNTAQSKQLREARFHAYLQKSKQSTHHSVHKGKLTLTLQIVNIMLIKGRVQSKEQYFYQVRIPSKRKQSILMNYKDLTTREIQFNLDKIPSKITFKIMQIRGIDELSLGIFQIQLDQFRKLRTISKKRQIAALKKQQAVQGTVEILFSVSIKKQK